MWELRMHLDYDDLYIPLTSGKFQSHKPSYFLWKKPTVVWIKISERKKKFRFENLLTQASK